MQEREADFTTHSGLEVDPVYGPPGAEVPGEYPYTRGPYGSMYRSKLWTMRMFAGFGTAPDTNRRFHDLLAAGGRLGRGLRDLFGDLARGLLQELEVQRALRREVLVHDRLRHAGALGDAFRQRDQPRRHAVVISEVQRARRLDA